MNSFRKRYMVIDVEAEKLDDRLLDLCDVFVSLYTLHVHFITENQPNQVN